MKRFFTARLLTAALLTLGAPAHAANLTVFAASSLTDAFTEIGRDFDRKTGNRTTFQFAGSQTLRAQLENGAQADVYASASDAQFTPLVGKLITARQVFARNTLTVIVPRGSSVRSLADLTRPGLRVVIASPGVPVGDYTRQMLAAVDRAGTYGRDYSTRFLKNVVSEEANVRQVALKVSLGEADAAVVYSSDLTPSLKGRVQAVALPGRFNMLASYPVGVTRASRSAPEARAFVAYLLSADGQRTLRKWGLRAAK
ncbi:molybdate ABC transporter substrate-binding protein [Deinococcus knuensis]|uniref:Molybdate ABC transporter substrate-binding protein n=1 Tax=Deinococcus knuensis TaxID=1837380 RepID=A0ABQ2SHH6_9DEIO|nr:molybdate ABC transporter substrate-binding protein [Deinococcus knuensis]GGS28784.1 molybdate ABC transporter substrate-binding protein [Deinococcus knuensis]